MSADDAQSPVIGFSVSGELSETPDSGPLWALLARSARTQPSALKGKRGSVNPRRLRGTRRSRGSRKRSTAGSRLTWKMLEAASAPLEADDTVQPVEEESDIDDVRVSPLVQSQWGQQSITVYSAGVYSSKPLYNYYTPNKWPCGCVATATAQLMRHHRYPASAAGGTSFKCWTNNVEIALSTIGGTYDWDAMPFEPDRTITDAEREAIGRICSDAGVSVSMNYGRNGSGSYSWLVPDALCDVFSYKSAEVASQDNADAADIVENAILANLDAGCPVMLGISSSATEEGHAILADGYGYDGGTLFCHLNMGWSGSCDFWYSLPSVEAGGYSFDMLDEVVYNIFPDGQGELVTGRVLECDGTPAAGVTVTAAYETSTAPNATTATTNVVSSATGVFAFRLPRLSSYSRTRTVRLSASSGSRVSATVSAQYKNSASLVADRDSMSPYDGLTLNYPTDSRGRAVAPRTGNSFGNSLYLPEAAAETPSAESLAVPAAVSADGATIAITFSGTPHARYAVERSDSLDAPDWAQVAEILTPAGGTATVEIPADGKPAGFFRIVPASR